MKKFRKAVVLKRTSSNSTFKAIGAEEPVLDQQKDLQEQHIQRRRTLEDESFVLNTAKIQGTINNNQTQSNHQDMYQDNNNIATKVTEATYDNVPNNRVNNSQRDKKDDDGDFEFQFNIVDDFIDRLNMGKIGNFISRSITLIVRKIMRSSYINTHNDGRLHIHSFALGILMTSLVVIIQPYLIVYLDSWIVLLGRLFKHLAAWLVVGIAVTYALNPKAATTTKKRQTSTDAVGPLDQDDDFEPIKYLVKTDGESSPKKSKKKSKDTKLTPYGGTPSRRDSDQQFLYKMTEQTQAIEKAKQDVEMSRKPIQPIFPSNYDHYMDNAAKSEKERQKYKNFVNDNRDVINMRKAQVFNDE